MARRDPERGLGGSPRVTQRPAVLALLAQAPEEACQVCGVLGVAGDMTPVDFLERLAELGEQVVERNRWLPR